MDIAVGNVDSVLVREGRVGSLPGCDTPTTAAQLDVARLHPRRAEPIEEVGLTCDGASGKISASDFAHVDLGRQSALCSMFVALSAYGILVGEETAVVESGIGVAHT